MKTRRPEPVHWRAFVQGIQIGLGYESKEEALQAAKDYSDRLNDGATLPNIDARASFLPLEGFRLAESKP